MVQVGSDIPFISIDRYFGTDIPCVASDNYGGGRIAAEKLAAAGLNMTASSARPIFLLFTSGCF